MAETFVSLADARQFAARHLCSDCWGHLLVYPQKSQGEPTVFAVRCATPGCPTHGYVSPHFVEKRESDSGFELLEARNALASVLPQDKKSENDLLKELGF